MTPVLPESVCPLSTQHDRRSFSCGEPTLDDYLQRYARQHAKAGISRTYVAVNGKEILGFYSLSMAAIRKDKLPVKYQARFPGFPLPVARLARLAVDCRYQRRSLGELLLTDALRRCLALSEQIGMIGVIVDAKHERAQAWYERYEFEHFPDKPLTLWLPTTAISRLWT